MVSDWGFSIGEEEEEEEEKGTRYAISGDDVGNESQAQGLLLVGSVGSFKDGRSSIQTYSIQALGSINVPNEMVKRGIGNLSARL